MYVKLQGKKSNKFWILWCLNLDLCFGCFYFKLEFKLNEAKLCTEWLDSSCFILRCTFPPLQLQCLIYATTKAHFLLHYHVGNDLQCAMLIWLRWQRFFGWNFINCAQSSWMCSAMVHSFFINWVCIFIEKNSIFWWTNFPYFFKKCMLDWWQKYFCAVLF